jgi:5'-deoxynucleotidase YfbR-like HD superfamily hydrolase
MPIQPRNIGIDPEAADLVGIAALLLRFGAHERVTRHPDGLRRESNAEHVVMLGTMAVGLAPYLVPHSSPGDVAIYSLVHDLVETYDGDTDSIGLSDAGRRDKRRRELAALQRLQQDTRGLPAIATAIEEYEWAQTLPYVTVPLGSAYVHTTPPPTPEAVDRVEAARFVRVLDKVLPRLTHALNGGIALEERAAGVLTLEDLRRHQAQQLEDLERDYPDQRRTLALLAWSNQTAETAMQLRQAQETR